MGTLIDGRAIANKIHAKTTAKVAALKARGITPKLGVILVGNDPASVMYDKLKGEAAKKAGLDFVLGHFPETISESDLIAKIIEIQSEHKLSGLIIQLPLPEPLYTPAVRNSINPDIDVDFLTDTNMEKILNGTNDLLPPTPGAVIAVLDELKVSYTNINIIIFGMGALVGKPLAAVLTKLGANVTPINSRSTDVANKCLKSDIVISAVGKKDLIRGNMIKPGAIVVDAGVCFENKKAYGDVNVTEALAVASFVTPTPGGVGPITVANLLYNTVLTAEKLAGL